MAARREVANDDFFLRVKQLMDYVADNQGYVVKSVPVAPGLKFPVKSYEGALCLGLHRQHLFDICKK